MKQHTSPPESEMPFWDHVEELRRHLLIALVALAVATLGSFVFAEEIINLLAEPVGSLDALQSIEVTENVSVFMRVSLLSGVAISLTFLLEFLGVATKPRLSSYINFITNLIFWMGIAFQFPIIIFALTKLGVVSVRTLAKGWRYALVLIAILAAMITPTVDPVNMALLMAPLFLLYLLSVLFASLAVREKKTVSEKEK